MELIIASAIGLMTGVGVYLVLHRQTFAIIIGLTLVSYAVNVFLFAAGRLAINRPPIISGADAYADPLPQALVLTAIVISFGMTALIVVLALRGFLEAGTDNTDIADMNAVVEGESKA
jgi:multicomponent K+:H+ antiporter subunit C